MQAVSYGGVCCCIGRGRFSALKRIKAFQLNATGQRRSGGLALMSVEKRTLCQPKKSDSLYDKVLDEFT